MFRDGSRSRPSEPCWGSTQHDATQSAHLGRVVGAPRDVIRLTSPSGAGSQARSREASVGPSGPGASARVVPAATHDPRWSGRACSDVGAGSDAPYVWKGPVREEIGRRGEALTPTLPPVAVYTADVGLHRRARAYPPPAGTFGDTPHSEGDTCLRQLAALRPEQHVAPLLPAQRGRRTRPQQAPAWRP